MHQYEFGLHEEFYVKPNDEKKIWWIHLNSTHSTKYPLDRWVVKSDFIFSVFKSLHNSPHVSWSHPLALLFGNFSHYKGINFRICEPNAKVINLMAYNDVFDTTKINKNLWYSSSQKFNADIHGLILMGWALRCKRVSLIG